MAAEVRESSAPRPVAPSEDAAPPPSHYKGFVAGIFSGIAKLSGMDLSLLVVFWNSWSNVVGS